MFRSTSEGSVFTQVVLLLLFFFFFMFMSQSHSLSGLWTDKRDPKETLGYLSVEIYFRHRNFCMYIPPWIIEQQLDACESFSVGCVGGVNISCSDCSWSGRSWRTVSVLGRGGNHGSTRCSLNCTHH